MAKASELWQDVRVRARRHQWSETDVVRMMAVMVKSCVSCLVMSPSSCYLSLVVALVLVLIQVCRPTAAEENGNATP